MFVHSGKVSSIWGEELPVMTSRKELKKEVTREEWEKLIAQGLRRTEEVWIKKRVKLNQILVKIVR